MEIRVVSLLGRFNTVKKSKKGDMDFEDWGLALYIGLFLMMVPGLVQNFRFTISRTTSIPTAA